jgi:hypothetical protein
MRKGQNPARAGLPAYTPNRLGMAALVYIPHLDGYFSQAFEILKAELASLRANTGEPFDLLVFDNGSCAEVQKNLQQLQADGWMDWLILSRHNLGKTGALNWIIGAMPNEILGYCDSDVFFRPGWFESSSRILDAFPLAGIVTAQPNFFDVFRGEGKAHLGLSETEYEKTDYHPAPEVVDEYCRGIGATDELTEKYRKQALTMYRRRTDGVEALLGANHMQFIGRRDVLRQVLPLEATKGLSPEEDRQFDMGLNRKGFVHLATPAAYVVHMGNTLDGTILPEVNSLNLAAPVAAAVPAAAAAQPFARRALGWLTRGRLTGKLLKRIYNGLFQIYTEGRT